MARFRFRLETLLEVRRRMERARQGEVAAIERERLELEHAIRARRAAAEAGRADLRRALEPGGPRSVAPVRLQAGAALTLESQTHQLAIRLAGVLRRLEEARGRLLEASRDRRAVERLREKRHEAWKRETARREAVEQDDLTSARSGVGRRAASGHALGTRPGSQHGAEGSRT